MSNLPNVNIILGNGALGRTTATSDRVAGMVLTGEAVEGKLELNKAYLLGSTSDLETLGITAENNFLIDKEVRAFYAQAGEGATLYILAVAKATTLTSMCDSADGSPLRKMFDAAGGRIQLAGVNKIAPAEYVADLAACIDQDAITAAEKAQQTGEVYAKNVAPFRMLMPAAGWTGETEDLYKPSQGSYNRVGFVLASDDSVQKSAAIGQVLGRLASLQVHQSIARVSDGAIATDGYATNGKGYLELQSLYETLHAAGYIFYRKFPTRNGCYLNSDMTAAPATDDYSALRLGRVIDKASTICYDTFIGSISDNVEVDDNGNIAEGACKSFEAMIENAITNEMQTEISSFTASIDPAQNILSTETMVVNCKIVPTGITKIINVNLAFENPAINS